MHYFLVGNFLQWHLIILRIKWKTPYLAKTHIWTDFFAPLSSHAYVLYRLLSVPQICHSHSCLGTMTLIVPFDSVILSLVFTWITPPWHWGLSLNGLLWPSNATLQWQGNHSPSYYFTSLILNWENTSPQEACGKWVGGF